MKPPSSSPTPASNGSADFVAKEVLRGLYARRFVPGQKLVEADLTREFGVSRSSVREALNRLSAEGVVTLTLHRGAYIRSLTRSDVAEVLDVMEVIVGLAARTAAQRIELPGHRELLDDAYNYVASFTDTSDFLAYTRARNAFYGALLKIGGNRELSRVLTGMQVHLVRAQFHGRQTMATQLRLRDYTKMTTAIRTGNGERAESVARQHINAVAQDIYRLPADAFAHESVSLASERTAGRARTPSRRASEI